MPEFLAPFAARAGRPTAVRARRFVLAAWLGLALVAGACSEEASSGSTSDASTAGDAAAAKDSEDLTTSCLGIAPEYRALFSQYDDQCAFLADCNASGECYCGGGCSSDKAMCAETICQDIDADCSCGEKCPTDGSVTLCPNYVCKDLGTIPGCEKQVGCRYVDQEQADKCKCTQMPDTEPNCYCGDACSADKPKCSATSGKCAGKNPDKCIIVPGQKWTKPYCARCGLKGDTPRCFFVITPDVGGG